MDSTRIKMKIGNHEFEAEGPIELVKEQFEAFKQLIAAMPARTVAQNPVEIRQNPVNNGVEGDNYVIPVDKIVKVDGRIVSLTARPQTSEEAALVIMLGQRMFRKNDAVTGSEMMDGLEQSGIRLLRADRMMEKLAGEGLVIKIGMGKGTRYRLTNVGAAKAVSVAQELIALVA